MRDATSACLAKLSVVRLRLSAIVVKAPPIAVYPPRNWQRLRARHQSWT